jgi:DNA-binding LytR/AlgR family response regulator
METEKYRCLVVDDEPIARKIITNYIERLSILQLGAERINALEALEYLRTNDTIDIIFLDINMPNLSGLNLLKIIQPRQPVIFTTAHTEYAVESYEFNATDYLLKPFSFERFAKAAYKAVSTIKNAGKDQREATNEAGKYIFIKSDGKSYPVLMDHILYCEAMKNYTMVMLNNGQKLMPLISLSKFENLLSETGGEFIQVHRSYLISKKHITAVSPNTVTLNKIEIPIGIQFREKFLKDIGMKGNH